MCFTTRYKGMSNVLENEVIIINTLSKNKKIKVKAIWDTGATHTSITKSVADALGLVPIDKIEVHGVNSTTTVNSYIIDMVLPSNVLINDIKVGEIGILSQDANALIGMNVINLGDFSVGNFKGMTSFSFRIPSISEADYVRKCTSSIPVSSQKTGRNDQCPCGSGKKYKHCCGKNN